MGQTRRLAVRRLLGIRRRRDALVGPERHRRGRGRQSRTGPLPVRPRGQALHVRAPSRPGPRRPLRHRHSSHGVPATAAREHDTHLHATRMTLGDALRGRWRSSTPTRVPAQLRGGPVGRGRAGFVVLACLGVAASLFVVSASSASGTATPRNLEVNVMNEPVRGGEPELAINPRNPNNLVLGHTVVGNTYSNNSTEAGEEAVNGGLQVSNDGGKTWTADRALRTSGYSEGPNPYLIAHGFPTATGFTLTINGVGDPIEAGGPDGSLYAGGVLAHTTSPGPPPFNFTVPQGAIAVARSANSGRTFGRISAVFSDLELQGMVSRGMNPKGIPSFGVNPFDRPWIAADQSTGAVYVSTTAHPQRYVTVSHDKARTWGRIEALDCDEMTAPNANHDVT